MKVKFNLPKKSYNSKLSFDNNTTFGFGNVQPLFSKLVVPHSKLTINFGQLTRLAPLVVPSFARLKQLNDFVFVPMNKVFPAFDAYLSRNMIHGTESDYVPSSVPCITNHRLFNLLVGFYGYNFFPSIFRILTKSRKLQSLEKDWRSSTGRISMKKPARLCQLDKSN